MATKIERNEDRTKIGNFNTIDVPLLRMDDWSEIGHHNIIRGSGKVVLGENAVISDHCSLLTTMRSAYGQMNENGDPDLSDVTDADIYLGKDAYIGPYSLICPGVRLGDGAVVGAYSYIIRDVPPNTMIRFKAKKLECERIWLKNGN